MRSLMALMMLLPQVFTHPVAKGDETPATLQAMRDRYRPLLVFSPSDSLPAYLAQAGVLAAHGAALAERDVVVVPIVHTVAGVPPPVTELKQIGLSALEQADVRRQYRVAANSFTVILLGKDGGEKLRSHTAVPFEQLQQLIDAMPMRRREMGERR